VNVSVLVSSVTKKATMQPRAVVAEKPKVSREERKLSKTKQPSSSLTTVRSLSRMVFLTFYRQRSNIETYFILRIYSEKIVLLLNLIDE